MKLSRRVGWHLPFLLLPLILLSSEAGAQESPLGFGSENPDANDWRREIFERQLEVPGAEFHSRAKGPFPNVELPQGVPAPAGELTVHADFGSESVSGDGVTLYLVNRTQETIRLPAQDGDLYFKLEALDENGRWVRVQNHRNSGCGNSYYGIELGPGEHLVLGGYLPSGGTEAQVRFRCAQNPALVSNPGMGRFLEEDRAAASLDVLTAEAPPSSLRTILDGPGGPWEPPKLSSRPYPDALRLLSIHGENAYYRKAARAYLETLPADSNEAGEIRRILASEWPPETDSGRLFAECLDILKADREESPADSGRTALAWLVVGDLILSQIDWSDGRRPFDSFDALYAMLGRAFATPEHERVSAAARLLEFDSLTNGHIETERLFEWTKIPNPQLFNASVRALAKRGEWERLANLGLSSEGRERLVILKNMASAGGERGRVRNPQGDAERIFWKHCAEEDPLGTVGALYYIGIRHAGTGNAFDLVLHDPLRKFLERESARSESADSGNGSHELSQAVSFVGEWRLREDVPVFRKLLHHPAFGESRVSSSRDNYLLRRYSVREAAKKALLSMDETVSEDIVIEVRIPQAN